MIKLFYGPDTYSINSELEKIEEKNPAEFKTIGVENIKDFIANLSSSSFFSEKRVFVARDIIPALTEKQVELLLEALRGIDKETDVYFIEGSKPKALKIFNEVKKVGEIKEYGMDKNINLVTFIKQEVESNGGTIAPLAAERLATFVGQDLWQLSEEAKKLVLYKTSDGKVEEIQTADVELLTHASFEATIFELTDAIAAKNLRRAATLINNFLKDGENDIYILTMISRQFKNIALAKFEPGATPASLAKSAGIHPYVAGKSFQQARNFDKKEIINMYDRLEDADLKLKSGADPGQTLLRLVA
jgi:DNA polymerase III delta subunit